jgi:hypothetical protein
MQLRTAVLSLALAFGWVAPGLAAEPVSIKIVEYGIYTAETTKPSSGVNETMKGAQVANVCHVMTTTIVPARDKLRFGFRFRVDGPLVPATVGIRQTVRFPDHTKSSDVPVAYVTNEQLMRPSVGTIYYTGWTNWKTRPGTWLFRLFQADRQLAEMTFTMVDKNDFSIEPEGNSTCFQLSAREGEVIWRMI